MTSYEIDALWDYNDPAATEFKFQELLSQADLHTDLIFEIQTQIARTYSLRKMYNQAHTLLDTLKPILSSQTNLRQCRYYLERGRTYNSSGERDTAYLFFQKAYTAALASHCDFYIIDALHMLAIADAENCFKWNVKALHIANSTEDQRARDWQSSLYNNIGWDHYDRQDYASALSYFQKCLSYTIERNLISKKYYALWAVSHVHRMLGEQQLALSSLQIMQMEYPDQTENDPFVYEELVENFLSLKELEKAKENLFIYKNFTNKKEDKIIEWEKILSSKHLL